MTELLVYAHRIGPVARQGGLGTRTLLAAYEATVTLFTYPLYLT